METTKKPTPPSDDIDLMRYVSLFLSNWLWIAAALFIALGVAYIYNRYSQREPTTSKSTLMIRSNRQPVPLPAWNNVAGNMYNPTLTRKMRLLSLHHILNRRVIDELSEHILLISLWRHGIQWQRTYKTSPFVLKELDEKQPYGKPLLIRFAGGDKYCCELKEKNGRKRDEDDREYKLGGL